MFVGCCTASVCRTTGPGTVQVQALPFLTVMLLHAGSSASDAAAGGRKARVSLHVVSHREAQGWQNGQGQRGGGGGGTLIMCLQSTDNPPKAAERVLKKGGGSRQEEPHKAGRCGMRRGRNGYFAGCHFAFLTILRRYTILRRSPCRSARSRSVRTKGGKYRRR